MCGEDTRWRVNMNSATINFLVTDINRFGRAPVIDVSVNAQDLTSPACTQTMKLRALLDTGSSDTSISSTYVKYLGQPTGHKPHYETMTEQVTICDTYNVLINIKVASFNYKMSIIPNSSLHACKEIDLIIGNDILRHSHIAINYITGKCEAIFFEP